MQWNMTKEKTETKTVDTALQMNLKKYYVKKAINKIIYIYSIYTKFKSMQNKFLMIEIRIAYAYEGQN